MKKVLVCMLCLVILLAGCGNETAGETTVSPTTEQMEINMYPGEIADGMLAAYEESLPVEFFTTTGEEIGLAGKVYLIEGVVDRIENHSEYEYIIVSTEHGEVAVVDTFAIASIVEGVAELGDIDEDIFRKYYPLPHIGERIKIVAEYRGMTESLDMACFLYADANYLIEVIVLSLNSVESTDPTEQTSTNDLTEAATVPPASTAPESEPTQTNVTLGKRNALKKAKKHLESIPFSYSGLVRQLEFEGYTNDEAIYAVDNCGADWNEQAKLCAANYLSFPDGLSSLMFNRETLIEQLEYEGFTHEQAVYGVEANGL